MATISDAIRFGRKYTNEQLNKPDFGHKGRLRTGSDLNDVFKTGTYYAVDCANRPTNHAYNVIVDYFDQRYVTQIAIQRIDGSQIYVRSRDMNYSGFLSDWSKVYTGDIVIPDSTIKNNKFTNNYDFVQVLTNEDLNNVNRSGTYISTSDLLNKPTGANPSAYIKVESYGTSFLMQTYTDLSDISKVWKRVVRYDGTVYKTWVNAGGDNGNSGGGRFSGKSMVMFGDSIAEYGHQHEVVSNITGLTTYTAGVGGTRIGTGHSDPNYDAFSGQNYINAVVTRDFSAQDTAQEVVNNPFYETIKGIDFNNIDYVSFAYGTNDWVGGGHSSTWEEKFRSAISDVVEKILTAYPHIKIMFFTPIWRARRSHGDGLETDNNPNGNGVYLIEYVDVMIDEANKNHITTLDMYRNSGINQWTETQYLNDGLHCTSAGYQLLGEKYGSFIMSNF